MILCVFMFFTSLKALDFRDHRALDFSLFQSLHMSVFTRSKRGKRGTFILRFGVIQHYNSFCSCHYCKHGNVYLEKSFLIWNVRILHDC